MSGLFVTDLRVIRSCVQKSIEWYLAEPGILCAPHTPSAWRSLEIEGKLSPTWQSLELLGAL